MIEKDFADIDKKSEKKNINQSDIKEKKKEKKSKKKWIYIIIFLLIIAFIIYLLTRSKGPNLGVSPTNLDFGAEQTENVIIVKNIITENIIFEPRIIELKYKVSVDGKSNWINISQSEGASEGEEHSITVDIDRGKLNIGKNRGKIYVKSNGGDRTINISAYREKDSITISSPSTNRSLTIGEGFGVKWKATPGISNYVNITLSLNDCEVLKVANNYNYRKEKTNSSGEYNWQLDDELLPGGKGYVLKVEDSKNRDFFDEVSPISLKYPITEIHFENVNTAHQVPSTVQYIFSLRDQYNHAVLIEDPTKLGKGALRIMENDKKIDYLESHPFLYTQNDFLLDVMLVLDFSASMKRYENGIKTMITGAKALINSLRETHKIGVIEFHKPYVEPLIIQPFSTDKNTVIGSIDKFSTSPIYNDFSICWDAVHKGLGQFPTTPNPRIFRALVFLSDGFDNSSTYAPTNLISLANERDIHIYIIGVGDVHEEEILKSIASKTGGTYVHAANICVLLQRFDQIINDLGGQYKLSYITPKKVKDNIFKVKSEIVYGGVTTSPPLEGKIDPAQIFGDTKNGIISFSSSINDKTDKAEMFMWCEYTPRYIHEFRFNLNIQTPFTVSLTSANEGGLCEDWSIIDEGEGWFKIKAPQVSGANKDLAFGTFGTICKIVIDEVNEEALVIPFAIDNSIYQLGQLFYGANDNNIDEEGMWNTTIKTN